MTSGSDCRVSLRDYRYTLKKNPPGIKMESPIYIIESIEWVELSGSTVSYRDRIYIVEDIILKLAEYGELNQTALISFCGLHLKKHKVILDEMESNNLITRKERLIGKKSISDVKKCFREEEIRVGLNIIQCNHKKTMCTWALIFWLKEIWDKTSVKLIPAVDIPISDVLQSILNQTEMKSSD